MLVNRLIVRRYTELSSARAFPSIIVNQFGRSASRQCQEQDTTRFDCVAINPTLVLTEDTGIQAEQLMKTGALVPDSMILRLIRNTLVTRGWLKEKGEPRTLTLNYVAGDLVGATADVNNDGFLSTIPPTRETDFDFTDHPDASFILDGFPRNEAQAKQIDALVPINLVVDIHTPADIIMDRICNRWIHAPSGRTYNTTFNPPQVSGKDDVTGEPLTQRDDDKPEVWQARLKKFEETSLPLLEHYDRQGVLWRVEGNSSDEISPRLFAEFEQRFGLQA